MTIQAEHALLYPRFWIRNAEQKAEHSARPSPSGGRNPPEPREIQLLTPKGNLVSLLRNFSTCHVVHKPEPFRYLNCSQTQCLLYRECKMPTRVEPRRRCRRAADRGGPEKNPKPACAESQAGDKWTGNAVPVVAGRYPSRVSSRQLWSASSHVRAPGLAGGGGAGPCRSPRIPVPLHATLVHAGHGLLPHGGGHEGLDGGGRELLGRDGLPGRERGVRTLEGLDGRDFRGT